MYVERVHDAGLDRPRTQIVAVVERDGATRLESEHRLHVGAHRGDRAAAIRLWVGRAQAQRLRVREAMRNVSVQLVVRGRLVREDVGHEAAREEPVEKVHGIRAHAEGAGFAAVPRRERPVDPGIEVVDALVDVARGEAPFDARSVHLRNQRRPATHRRGERLRATHAAEACRHDEPPHERAVLGREIAARGLGEGLVGALQDALRADVDPRARRHLAVHREAEGLEPPELVPRGPVRYEVGVREKDARGILVRAKDPHRLPGLDEERLVVAQTAQLVEDRREAGGISRGLARSSVNDEILPALGHLGIEVVQKHPVRSLREPGTAREGRSFRDRRRREDGGDRGAWHRASC